MLHAPRLSLAILSLSGLLLTGCAVQQPISGGQDLSVWQGRRNSALSSSMFAGRKATPEPEAPPLAAVEPEPAPTPRASAQPEPEPDAPAAAEPAPKRRGPLTYDEVNEIDNQVMP